MSGFLQVIQQAIVIQCSLKGTTINTFWNLQRPFYTPSGAERLQKVLLDAAQMLYWGSKIAEHPNYKLLQSYISLIMQPYNLLIFVAKKKKKDERKGSNCGQYS